MLPSWYYKGELPVPGFIRGPDKTQRYVLQEEKDSMKKLIAAAAATALAASMVTTAFADDVSVRTSVGSGEVVFTETSEEANISAEELTKLVKDSLSGLHQHEVLNTFLDTEASVSLKVSDQNEINLSGSVIGDVEKNGTDGYASLFYSFEGIGTPQSNKFEAYHWVKDDTHFSASSTGDGWTVKQEDFISSALESVSSAMDSDEIDQISLIAPLPHLYEENGVKYYVCVYDKDSIVNTAGGVSGAEMYTMLADSILGDNDVKLTVVVNAETGFPRAVSLNADGAAGQLPAEMMGGEGSLEYTAKDFYATLLMDTEAQSVQIPEEVLNTPVTEDKGILDLDLDSLLAGVGSMVE